MADTAEAVKQQQDESTGEGERERSTISFPYLDLDDALEVTKAVHGVGGTSCAWDQLAAKLGASAKGGGFRMRVLTAKIFGLLSYDKGTVALSDLGLKACDPQQEKAARADAFLSVPLYRKVYDQFKGTSLPGIAGIENFMVSAGVAPKQKDKARQVFQRSAKTAGFFDLSSDRLTYPSTKGSARPSDENDRIKQGGDGLGDENRRNGGSDGGGGDKRHPLIEGLIKALPGDGDNWPLDSRKKWLQAAAMNFDFVYQDSPEETGSLKVTIEREGSAKA